MYGRAQPQPRQTRWLRQTSYLAGNVRLRARIVDYDPIRKSVGNRFLSCRFKLNFGVTFEDEVMGATAQTQCRPSMAAIGGVGRALRLHIPLQSVQLLGPDRKPSYWFNGF